MTGNPGNRADDDAESPERGRGLPAVPKEYARQVRLVARALREHWPMTAKVRAAAIAQLESVVTDAEAIRKKPRAFHTAVKALVALSRVNLTAVDVAIRAQQHEELAARLAELEAKLGGTDGRR